MDSLGEHKAEQGTMFSPSLEVSQARLDEA